VRLSRDDCRRGPSSSSSRERFNALLRGWTGFAFLSAVAFFSFFAGAAMLDTASFSSSSSSSALLRAMFAARSSSLGQYY
jgi:hypothetical protein